MARIAVCRRKAEKVRTWATAPPKVKLSGGSHVTSWRTGVQVRPPRQRRSIDGSVQALDDEIDERPKAVRFAPLGHAPMMDRPLTA
jgi:hypothetical protein